MSCPINICGKDSKSLNKETLCLRNYATGNVYTDKMFKESVKVSTKKEFTFYEVYLRVIKNNRLV